MDIILFSNFYTNISLVSKTQILDYQKLKINDLMSFRDSYSLHSCTKRLFQIWQMEVISYRVQIVRNQTKAVDNSTSSQILTH